MKNKNAINSQQFAHAKSYLNEIVHITDAYTENKWLVLQLDNGIRFRLLN